MLEIYLVRHGQSEANANRKRMREENIPDYKAKLTDFGYAQAVEAKEFFSRGLSLTPQVKTRLIYSPLDRARETASIIQNGFHVPGLIDMKNYDTEENDLLAEQSYGLFDGYEDEELEENFPKEFAHYSLADKYWHAPPQGESRIQVVQRQYLFINMLLQEHELDGINRFIIVCHGVTIRAFIKAFMRYPYEWMMNTVKHPNPFNCEVRKISSHRAGSKNIYKYEGTVWLPSEGVRTK